MVELGGFEPFGTLHVQQASGGSFCPVTCWNFWWSVMGSSSSDENKVEHTRMGACMAYIVGMWEECG
jgi:hypothetical protein